MAHASHILRGYLTPAVHGGIIALFCRFPDNRSTRIFEHAIVLGQVESSFESPPMLSASHPTYSAGAGVLVLSVGRESRDRASQFSWSSTLR